MKCGVVWCGVGDGHYMITQANCFVVNRFQTIWRFMIDFRIQFVFVLVFVEYSPIIIIIKQK